MKAKKSTGIERQDYNLQGKRNKQKKFGKPERIQVIKECQQSHCLYVYSNYRTAMLSTSGFQIQENHLESEAGGWLKRPVTFIVRK